MLKRFVVMTLVLAAVIGMAACPAEGKAAGGEMTLLSVNVRKADAHLLRCGDEAYLIDTGTKDSFDHLYSVLKDCGVTRLRMLSSGI